MTEYLGRALAMVLTVTLLPDKELKGTPASDDCTMQKMLKNIVSSISEGTKKSEIGSTQEMRTGMISKLNNGEM